MTTFYGGDGNDDVLDFEHKDHLYGGAGNDYLVSNIIGSDYWEGGEGNDSLIAQAGAFGSFYGGNGNDLISQTPTSFGSEMYGGSGDDAIEGGPGILDGGAGRDSLRGSDGADILYGGLGNELGAYILVPGFGKSMLAFLPSLAGLGGNDIIDGGLGDDLLYGGADDDTLTGGPGRDIFVGGVGDDTLTGDAGRDTFQYYSTDDSRNIHHHDVIVHFEDGPDVIDLSRIDAKTTHKGDQAFRFVGDHFDGRPGALMFDRESHALLGDTDGDMRPDFYIKMPKVDALHADDFDL